MLLPSLSLSFAAAFLSSSYGALPSRPPVHDRAPGLVELDARAERGARREQSSRRERRAQDERREYVSIAAASAACADILWAGSDRDRCVQLAMTALFDATASVRACGDLVMAPSQRLECVAAVAWGGLTVSTLRLCGELGLAPSDRIACAQEIAPIHDHHDNILTHCNASHPAPSSRLECIRSFR
jgi:hypothetical protein